MKIHPGILVTLLLFLVAFISCKKDDGDPVEESPFFVFFDQPAITIDTTPVAANTWEYGFVFSPVSDGEIKQLGLKLPVSGTFSVRLWDLSGATPVVLSEKTVTAAASHTPAFASISPVAVKKFATLGVTIQANSFYRLEKKDGSDFAFPIAAGNIQIISFNEETSSGGAASFPKMPNKKRVAPCVNVIFVAK